MKKTTTNSGKKRKTAAKKKIKSMPAKKLKGPVKKAKSTAGKKAKDTGEVKRKKVAKKNVRKTASGNPKPVISKKTKKSLKAKTKSPDRTQLVEEKITHGEDLHLIPVEGEIHPIDTVESHRLENIFQNREEVTLQQENRKVKDALGSRKNLTKNFRIIRHK